MELTFNKRAVFLLAILFLCSNLVACESIDKALYSATDSLTSVDRVTGERSLNIYSRAEQIQKSNAMTNQMVQQQYLDQGKKINSELDMKAYKRLQRIFEPIHQVSHLRDEKWSVILLPEDSFNAFVMGGTYVLVNKGLMDEVKSDDELAYILGHEIAHVAANHVYEGQSYNMGALLAGSKSVKRSSFQAAYTHENEEEADRVGLLYSTLAGYDPMASKESWVRMGSMHGQNAANYSTHPIAKERAETNEKLATLYKEYYKPGIINPNYKEILKNNTVFSDGGVTTRKPGEGGGVEALLGTALSVFSDRSQTKAEEQRQAQRIAFIQSIQSQLSVRNIQALNDGQSVSVQMIYNGNTSVKNLVFKGLYNKELEVLTLDRTIMPRETLNLVFKFEDDGFNPKDLSPFRMALDYAEAI